ncbi:hypothetical protein [Phormidium sp. CCY1219]|uniref:hypothetical protein n=1 Tax=Phormidium sp. CCY1219 TaxID=2886104 RepID=UPI002D1EC851|nr:hypothetical protein [Phormidium sp. CCY1219]MEB3828756.1 hypothetical protein [Phormidium sp. CCY1219]
MSSERYQSKLFNFLDRRSRQVAKHLEKAKQQLKAIAASGAHLAMIPLYAAYQATRFIGKQLKGSVQSRDDSGKNLGGAATEEPPSPSVDSAIDRLLSAVEIRESTVGENSGDPVAIVSPIAATEPRDNPETSTPASGKFPGWGGWKQWMSAVAEKIAAPGKLALQHVSRARGLQKKSATALQETEKQGGSVVVRAIATQLDTRRLVFVTPGNQILDLLTPAQQEQLQARIQWELAAGGHGDNPQFKQPKKTAPTLSGESSGKTLPAPPRGGFGFAQLGNSLDRALNSLENAWQNSGLVLQPSGMNEVPPQAPVEEAQPHTEGIHRQIQAALLVVDGAVARLEGMELPPGSGVGIALADRTESLMQTIQKWAIALVTDPDLNPDAGSLDSENPRALLKIQLLIQTAIDYLFSEDPSNPLGPEARAKLDNPSPTAPPLSGNGPTANRPAIAQKFQNVNPIREKSGLEKEQFPENPKPPLTLSQVWGTRAIAKFLSDFPLAPPASPRKAPEPSSRPTAAPHLESVSAVQPATRATTPTVTVPPAEESDSAPNWIEAQVLQVEYIKHPLEVVLHWLDRLMVRVEELVVRLWDWMRHSLIG